MKKFISLLALIIGFVFSVQSQQAYLFDDNMAVFYPAGFVPDETLPSLAIERELPISSGTPLPGDWKVTPMYSNGGKTVIVNYDATTDLYGTGEVLGPLRRNGESVELWNTDNYLLNPNKPLYKSLPWIMGVRTDGSCFGIISDHTYRQRISSNNTTITIASDGPAFRVVVIERDSPAEMMQALSDLTGKINLPPLWALGFQQCRYSYPSATSVMQVANTYRDKNIPCDVIWMDIDHMANNYQTFTFNGNFPNNSTTLNNDLHNINFKSVYIVDAGIQVNGSYWVYNEGITENHFVKNNSGSIYQGDVWPGRCAFPDFTRPQTRDWWKGLQKDHLQYGADGIWNDMNEPSIFGGIGYYGTMPDNNQHAGGNGGGYNLPAGNHLRYHNVYGMLMSKTTREACLEARPNLRPFSLSRATFLGGQRYTASWTGDNVSSREHMKVSIPMSITLGLSGQPFSGPDIGGYGWNKPGDMGDLFKHWMALGAFYPFARNHTEAGSPSQEPWEWGAEAVSRTAINRRYKLLPYFYTAFREASVTGMPVMRPVFFADPADLTLRREQEAFLWGGDLLIQPRWATDTKFPQGKWQKMKLEDTADDGYQVNVFMRPGAIVPMLENVIQSTVDYNTSKITLIINPNEDGTAYGKLYDDAGNGFGYKDGDYSIHEFNSTKEGNRLKIEITKAEGERNTSRQYRIGYITCGDIVYTPYSSETTQYIDFIDEANATMFISASWDNALIPMTSNDCGVNWSSDYMRIGEGAQTMVFTELENYSGNMYGNAAGNSGIATSITNTAQAINLTAPGDGMYKVSFNKITGEYSFVKETVPALYNHVAIVGCATVNGWLPTGSAETNFTQDKFDPNIWHWRGMLHGEGTNPNSGINNIAQGGGLGEFKIHLFNGQWCEGNWVMANMQSQPITDTSFRIFAGCEGERPENGNDCKWKVQTSETGEYTVKLDVANNILEITPVSGTSSLNDENALQLSVYYDDAYRQLYIRNEDKGRAEVNIYSSTGQLMKRKTVQGLENTIKLNENPNSVLLIEIVTDKGSKTVKILTK